ncbi:MAG: hypothetical protein ACYCPQ_05255 [Elusimicrobiota bacterium]
MIPEEPEKNRWVYVRRGRIEAHEFLELSPRPGDGGWKAVIEKKSAARDKIESWRAEAILGADWKVLSLEIKMEDGSAAASCGWRDDVWSGTLICAGGYPDVFNIPMAEELDVYFPCAAFDAILLRRLGLLPMSQRRIEILEVSDKTLRTIQSHRIIERLGDSSLEKMGQSRAAALYRVIDSLGGEEKIWAHPDTAILFKKEASGGLSCRRLEPFPE